MKTIFIVTKIIKVKLYKYILKNKLPVTLKGQTKIVCTSGSGCTVFFKIHILSAAAALIFKDSALLHYYDGSEVLHVGN